MLFRSVKLAWLRSKFSQLSEHPTDEEVVYSTRAYLLYLIGSTLFSDKERGYVSPKYLPLLSNFEEVREYAWGAAALAQLYRNLSKAMSSYRKRLFGSVTLLMVCERSLTRSKSYFSLEQQMCFQFTFSKLF